jgi:hypothetical protein
MGRRSQPVFWANFAISGVVYGQLVKAIFAEVALFA